MVAYLKWFSKYLHCFVYIDTMHTDQYMSRTLAIQSAYPQFPAVWCQFLHVLTSRCLYSQHMSQMLYAGQSDYILFNMLTYHYISHSLHALGCLYSSCDSWSAKKPKSLFGEPPLLKMFLLTY